MSIDPHQNISTLKGVGPALRDQLGRLGIFSLGDLLLHLPLRYQDRSRVVPLREAQAHKECLVVGQVVDADLRYGRRRSLRIVLDDGTGYLGLRFFHFSNGQRAALKPGVYVRCFGEVRFGSEGLEMVHPEYRTFDSPPPEPEPSLTPVYSTTQGVGQNRLRALTDQLMTLDWPEADGTPWTILKWLHRPPADATEQAIAQAQERIALDELTAYYLIMRRRQADRERQLTTALPPAHQLGRRLLQSLGFRLTGAQKRVVREVLDDLSSDRPMLRLLQGDVGSGKTVVAAFAAVRAAEHGRQTALMAPTEILAEQHYVNFAAWLEPLGIPVVLITGSQTAKERRERQAAVAAGEALVAVGTHALFQKDVQFDKLALTIVDEQHRFGVHQRMALREKGAVPHQLVMTATPIPRTLTMALYADMAVSVIDEMPRGRMPIDTAVVADSRRSEVASRIAAALKEGQQAYWVCPLIESSELVGGTSVDEALAYLRGRIPNVRSEMLHGRMAPGEKAEVMVAFKRGDIQVLVATTVIEVGVDVPNATVMVIENPERMGLAQLHQLRGRVGRGSQKSLCILLYRTPLSATARARLRVIRESTDGFYIAEQDLKLRGPGELLGSRQTGEQQFRMADLSRHAHLLPQVMARGDRLLREDAPAAQRLLRAWAPADTGHTAV